MRKSKGGRGTASITEKIIIYRAKLQIALFSLLFLTNLITPTVAQEAKTSILEISMPNVRPMQEEEYLCTAKDVSALGTQYIRVFEPNSNAIRAHHMALFVCDAIPQDLLKSGWWSCLHHFKSCNTTKIIYAWARNAQATILPPDIGLRIGVILKYLILQVHYAELLPDGQTDQSGFRVHITTQEPRYLAGVMLLYSKTLQIPPHTENAHGDMNCALNASVPIHPFAFRVHTHKLGVVGSAYFIDSHDTITEIGKGNPQWPQCFNPIQKNITINPLDKVLARCTYNSTNFPNATQFGQTADDEMCAVYIMFYTESRNPDDHTILCFNEQDKKLSSLIPDDSDVPLPRNVTLEEYAKSHLHHSGALQSA